MHAHKVITLPWYTVQMWLGQNVLHLKKKKKKKKKVWEQGASEALFDIETTVMPWLYIVLKKIK